MNEKILKYKELWLFLGLGATLGVFLVISLVAEAGGNPNEPVAEVEKISAFEGVNVAAKSAYVYDVRSRSVLFAKNEDLRLPLASLTKIMTALVAAEMASPETTITITREAIRTQGDSGLKVGERWLLKNLLDFSLTNSSNDGIRAAALAVGALGEGAGDPEELFIRKMNDMADELLMNDTYFFNTTGLDESKAKGGAYGTAKDMAALLEYILQKHPELLAATQNERLTVRSFDTTHVIKNTNSIVGDIPGLLNSKTGYTDIAGGNLVLAFDPEVGRPIIVSVLGSSAEERFTDAALLVERAMQYIQLENSQ